MVSRIIATYNQRMMQLYVRSKDLAALHMGAHATTARLTEENALLRAELVRVADMLDGAVKEES